MGLPEASVQMMVQAEREQLYPEIAKKAKAKRDAEGVKRARENSADTKTETDDEDADAQMMMDEAIRNMGQNPAEVNKKMSDIPDSKLNNIPKLSTNKVGVTPANEQAPGGLPCTIAGKKQKQLSALRKKSKQLSIWAKEGKLVMPPWYSG